jgi:uncharacterized protein (TIGR04255 family)
MAAATRISFKRPPLTEVVCGLQFRPVSGFQATHYGLFWQTIRKEFPTSRTVFPIGNDPVQFPLTERQEITVTVGPDLPRVWLISGDDSRLVQLQPDRLLFNWRDQPDAKYPRYPTIIARFKQLFAKYQNFLKDNGLGEISLVGTELSYINTIKPGAGWHGIADLGGVFPDFSWRREDRLLSTPEAINFRSTHPMPSGRLHVAIQTAKSKEQPEQHVRFDLTARGNVSEIGPDAIWNWFDNANTFIVRAFVDLTSESMQRTVWEKV